MASLMTALRNPAGLEERVEAFESAWKSGHCSGLVQFLPASDSASFLSVLCELVRVDLELHWECGQRRQLEEYLHEFPSLRDDPDALCQIAFEEYRQRVQAGEAVTPQMYQKLYGVDVASWPPLSVPAASAKRMADSHATREFSDRDLVRAVAPQDRRVEQARKVREAASKAAVRFPKVGETWQGFQLVDELGRGTFGRVYLARQVELSDRLVALKVSTDLTGEPQKLAQLQHTHIMPVYSTHQVGDLQAVCMPFFGSTTLAHLIRGLRQASGALPTSGRMFLSTLLGRSRATTHGSDHALQGSAALSAGSASHLEQQPASSVNSLSARSFAELDKLAEMTHVDAVLWIMTQVADGLVHAHARGILHRDLKPANILLTDEGQPMLLDFNLAASVHVPKGTKIKLGGTFPYMAPEQLEAMQGGARTVDARSDLYSLGVILFELLTGHYPFSQPRGKPAEILSELLAERRNNVPDPRKYNAKIPAAVAAIVAKLLAGDPAQRYQSAQDLKEDLERHQEHLPLVHAPNPSLAERLVKLRRRHPRLCTAVGVAVATGLLVVMPATVLAIRQDEMARRVRATQRAEALVQLADSREKLRGAVIDLGTKDVLPPLRQRGLQAAEAVVAQYGIGRESGWLNSPELTRLNEDERRQFLGELGNAFLTVARNVQREAVDKKDDALAAKAMNWNQLAETCFVRLGPVPESVAAQRDAISGGQLPRPPLEDEASPERLSKMDETDLYATACDLESAGRHRVAVKYLEELTKRNPTHFMGWYFRGVCSYQLGRDAAAYESFTVCIALRPDEYLPYFTRGLVAFRLLRLSQAEDDLTRAIKLQPGVTEALIRRALIRRERKEYREAIEDLTEALQYPDVSVRAWLIRSELHAKLKETDAARKDLAEGLKREPTDEQSFVYRGYYRMLVENDLVSALQDMDSALALNPRNREALQNKAYILAERKKDHAAGKAALRTMLDYYPDYLPAHMGLGVVLAREGKAEEAKKAADLCLALDRSPYYLFKIGCLYSLLAKHDPTFKAEALKLLGEALRTGYDKPYEFVLDPDLNALRDDPEFKRMVGVAQELHKLREKR